MKQQNAMAKKKKDKFEKNILERTTISHLKFKNSKNVT